MLRQQSNLTIVVTISSLLSDLYLCRLIGQNNAYTLNIVDRNHITNYNDVIYKSNENVAINDCSTKYITFIDDNCILTWNYVGMIEDCIKRHHSDMYVNYNMHMGEWHFDNFIPYPYCNHAMFNLNNMVFNVDYLRHNNIGFDTTIHFIDIMRENFALRCILLFNNKYHMDRHLIDICNNVIIDDKYLLEYRDMLEKIKIHYHHMIQSHDNYEEMIRVEDKYYKDNLIKYNENIK